MEPIVNNQNPIYCNDQFLWCSIKWPLHIVTIMNRPVWARLGWALGEYICIWITRPQGGCHVLPGVSVNIASTNVLVCVCRSHRVAKVRGG